MGWGDDLMAAGEARQECERTGKRVAIRSLGDYVVASQVWNYCPDIDQKSAKKIFNAPGCRPYIGQSGSDRHGWKKYKPIPARIELSLGHKEWAQEHGEGFVIVEPNVKPRPASRQNKAWGVDNYRQVVQTLRQYDWVQPVYGDMARIDGARKIQVPSFIHMLALMERSAGYLGPEGGLHHAAAAFGKPAVVIFGGFISPQVTGYDFHHNIFTGTGLGCGAKTKCNCQCLESISVGQVIEAVNKTIPLDPAAHPA